MSWGSKSNMSSVSDEETRREKEHKNLYNPSMAGFPSTESAKMIDKLFMSILPTSMATGRLQPNPDMSLAIELVADFKATIESRGGLELWEQINNKGQKLMLQGELDEDAEKINKGRRLLEKIDTQLWEDFLVLENKVIQTTLVAMGASRQAPVRLDDIMAGFSKNFTVSMNMNKKPGGQQDEIMDLREQ
jgi:hypothetical protein